MASQSDDLTRPLRDGEPVRAFYHAHDHPQGYRYVRLPEALAMDDLPTEAKPVIGLSTGWIPATVVETPKDQAVDDGRVLVFLQGLFDDHYHPEPDGQPVCGMYWRVPRSLVRPMGSSLPEAALSLLVVRWGNYHGGSKSSRSHDITNDAMLRDILLDRGSPHAACAPTGSYEVFTAFIRNTDDLSFVEPLLARTMRSSNRVGMYFLWPSQSHRLSSGMVSEHVLLDLMHRMEMEGVRTCWPHPQALYRQLAGKLWAPGVSRGRPDLRVPPTVKVDWQRFRMATDVVQVATGIIQELIGMRPQGGAAAAPDSYRGVAKLGFSWMGEGVRAFEGPRGLVAAIRDLRLGTTDAPVCLVQERVEGVACELRLVCCRDRAREDVTWELVRMRQKPQRRQNGGADDFSVASHENMKFEEATADVFGGRSQALKAAEDEVRRLGKLWLQWFESEGFGLPAPAFRLDFIVANAARAVPQVWTVELCECGGSLCSLAHDARTTATLNECLAGPSGDFAPAAALGAQGSFPRPLPAMRAAAYERRAAAYEPPARRRQDAEVVSAVSAKAEPRRQWRLSAWLAGFFGSPTGQGVVFWAFVFALRTWVRRPSARAALRN